MISCEEAKKIIEANCRVLPAETVFLALASGTASAEDVLAPISLPLFTNSAMDGFALDSTQTMSATEERPVSLRIACDIKAGDKPRQISLGETARIMTGAPLPEGSDAVLEKEKSILRDGFLVLKAPVSAGRNVRRPGEEIKEGELAFSKNGILNPGAIGFLSGMGIERIRVFRKPRVSVITTGSELMRPGSRLKPGKIYDSNATMLLSALQDLRIQPILIRQVKDESKLIHKILSFALKNSDLVILTGGVSVGEYDPVKAVLGEAGAETLFWKVSQKPGKPIYCGKKNKTLIFGLPGNPAAVFTCFYEYIYPAIRMMSGHSRPYLAEESARLLSKVEPDKSKTLFLKGHVVSATEKEKTVLPLRNQKSHMLSSLRQANALVVVSQSSKELEEGDAVSVHLLPYGVS